MKVRVFADGHGSKPVEFELGPYGYIETAVDGRKVRINSAWFEGPYISLRIEDFGVMKVLPRVANEVYIGVDRT